MKEQAFLRDGGNQVLVPVLMLVFTFPWREKKKKTAERGTIYHKGQLFIMVGWPFSQLFFFFFFWLGILFKIFLFSKASIILLSLMVSSAQSGTH